MDLFAVHFVPLSHMPAAAESTWHGSCLACAEIARRGLVSPAKLPKLIEWMEKVRRRHSSTQYSTVAMVTYFTGTSI
jgi:hypothetical protein